MKRLIYIILIMLLIMPLSIAYTTPEIKDFKVSNISILLYIKNSEKTILTRFEWDILIEGCMINNQEALGEYYINLRNKYIEKYHDGLKYSYEELWLLSKIIEAEAGMNWLDEYIRMCVGEVVLNRVESPEFPNTIYEVIYEEGQYHHVKYDMFNDVTPTEKSIKVAQRLLNGDRLINNKSVVFQANFPQGSGVHESIYDELLGYTYLCYSNNLEIYLQTD